MKQPEALRLAVLGSFRGGLTLGEVQEAEDELNRLVAQRDALLEALERIAQLSMSQFHIPYDMAAEACNIASAAINAVEGENT